MQQSSTLKTVGDGKTFRDAVESLMANRYPASGTSTAETYDGLFERYFGVAKQQLGNSDMKTVQVYAVRSTAAFSKYSDKKWAQAEGAGRKWSQSGVLLEIVKDS